MSRDYIDNPSEDVAFTLRRIDDTLERVASSLERLADALDPSEERMREKVQQAQRIGLELAREMEALR